MRIRIHIFLVCWILSSTIVAAEQTIYMNTTGQLPLSSPEKTGFLDRVGAEVFRRCGLKLETVQVPAERGLINANQGIEDGEMSRIAGLEKIYPNLVMVPETIMDWEFVAFSEQEIDLSDGWSDLTKYSVAFINGWKILENNVPASAEITKVKNQEQLFKLLINKRSQIVIYERWAGLHYIKQTQLQSIKPLQPVLSKRNMYMYLNKKHQALVPKLASALKAMKQDGTYDKLVKEILEPLR